MKKIRKIKNKEHLFVFEKMLRPRTQAYTRQQQNTIAENVQEVKRAVALQVVLDKKLLDATSELNAVTVQLTTADVRQKPALLQQQQTLIKKVALANSTLETFYKRQTEVKTSLVAAGVQ